MPASSTKKLSHYVTDRIRPHIQRQEVAGAVVLIAKKGRIIEFDAAGYADLKKKRPVKKNDMFWVASMTKPIVATAILMLSDEGKLSVDDPVEKHLPAFKDMWLVTEKTDDRMVLTKSPVKLTLRHLLAHTDGLFDVPLPHAQTPLAEWVTSVGRMPLQFQPGTKWVYNNSGLNTLGRIVEVVSGQSLPDFFAQRLFRPLKMKDTTFVLSNEQFKRLATSYKFEPEKKQLEPTPIFIFQGKLTDKRLTICPGGGLFSTATDMFIFYQMLLDGGTREGRRYLSKTAFKELTTIQTGDMETGFTEGMSFGLGVGIVRKPVGITAMLSPGTFGHGGAYGTQAWGDPVRQSLMILMVQQAGFPHAPAPGNFHFDFNTAVGELIAGKKTAS
jgi:CubicO group peptidase (beta-lactamase class C family)